MSRKQYEQAAYRAVQTLANDERVHERFVQVRAALECQGCTRNQLIQIATFTFAQMTRQEYPNISDEEFQENIESKLAAFMWLIDNV